MNNSSGSATNTSNYQFTFVYAEENLDSNMNDSTFE